MAKLVLAGKADCPYYAKAELLADLLQRNLPNFRIHKICMHPNDWKQWLEETCSTNGWKHERSPIVWRELIDRGGKGMLLGGFSEFLEHVQGYYGNTSAMATELMIKVAAENLQTKELCMEEEVYQRSLLQPLHIWISSVLNPTCYSLIPQLFTPGVFCDTPTISLHLLEVGASEEALEGVRMETEDLALPQLHQVSVHSDLVQAFHQAHLIVFLDDWQPMSERNEEQEDGEDAVSKVSERFQGYGRLIEARAHEDVRVIVAGDSFVNLKCSLLLEHAPAIDPRRFVAMVTQLENEARAQIAQKLRVKTADVTDVIVWGNISGTSHVDLQRAKVFRYEGAISGPSGFSQPVLELIYDRKWLESEFPSLVSSQRATVASKTRRAAAISATNGIIAVLRAWNKDSAPHEVFSLGVFSTGQFGIPPGLVFSMPVSFQDGGWAVQSDVTISDELRIKLGVSANQLKAEKEMAAGVSKNAV